MNKEKIKKITKDCVAWMIIGTLIVMVLGVIIFYLYKLINMSPEIIIFALITVGVLVCVGFLIGNIIGWAIKRVL